MFIQPRILLCAVLAIVALSGCASIDLNSQAKSTGSGDSWAMANNAFRTNNVSQMPLAYDALADHTDTKTIDSPLFLCEQASLALLMGHTELAEKTLDRVINLLEGFFDKESEKKALSLWGRESEKVFKGDPYERAVIYMLYGMCLLERNDVDNAFACFKRALLMDGDTEKNSFRSDFALPFLLAAKCHDLRGEHESRDEMLKYATQALCDMYPWLRFPFKSKLLAAVAEAVKSGAKPNKATMDFLAWGKECSTLTEAMTDSQLEWLKTVTANDNTLDFNAVFVIWNGHGPMMSRGGQYGEIRLINTYPTNVCSDNKQTIQYSIFKQGRPHERLHALDHVGNVSYQAATRGYRRMDEELRQKANIKTATNAAGSALVHGGLATTLLSNTDAGNLIGLGISLIGLAVKVTAASMTPEADIRCWRFLPSEFTIVLTKLEPGKNVLYLDAKTADNTHVSRKELVANVSPDAPVSFFHIIP